MFKRKPRTLSWYKNKDRMFKNGCAPSVQRRKIKNIFQKIDAKSRLLSSISLLVIGVRKNHDPVNVPLTIIFVTSKRKPKLQARVTPGKCSKHSTMKIKIQSLRQNSQMQK